MKSRFINLIFCFVFLTNALFAQLSVNSHYPTRHRGFWTLGINGGSAYQSSDISRLYDGWGVGLTLGKNLYYRPGAAFSFDARGRFLFTKSYGIDTKRSYGILYNNSVNGTYDSEVNYLKPKGKGYIFANHATGMGELALEGVLTFNRFRERTGIVASVFGGVGLNLYGVATNQTGADNKIYTSLYESIDTSASRKTIQQRLKSGMDNYYETSADDNETLQLGIMPALGFELGYQFAPRFHASLGYRTTFSLRDNLDGQLWNNLNQATGTNDRLHYTYLKMEWELNKINQCKEPKISILAPEESPYITSLPSARVTAKIENIKNALDVNFKVNGESRDFGFYNPRVSQEINLVPGNNVVEITATNVCGKDVKTIIIVYNPTKIEEPQPKQEAPIITITSPQNNPYTVENQYYTINATVLNVNDYRSISFKQNGNDRNFTFDNSRKIFSSDVTLIGGKNTFEIVAKNAAGIANAQTIIYYEIKEDFPKVTIVEPVSDYTETYETSRNIRATTENIKDKNQIRFRVNGRNVDFNFNANRGEITKNLSLDEGNNDIRIEVENSKGSVNDAASIVRKRDIYVPPPTRTPQPPVVRITSPSSSRTTTYDDNGTIRATIQNVAYPSDVTFLINGRKNNSFSYRNGQFTADVNLEKGKNSFTIRAQNADGNDEASVTIVKEERYTPPVAKRPEITIASPKSGSVFTVSSCELEAYVKNVDSKNELTVTQNGNRIDFAFSPISKKIKADVNLVEGSNTIRIKAQNDGGTDEASVTVTYRRPSPPPTVNINSPTNGSTTDKSSTTLNATVQNIDNKGDISVTLNGRNISFRFVGTSLTAEANLVEGSNTFNITARNSSGNDEKSVTVTYRRPTPPPTVNITNPANGSTTDRNKTTLVTTVQNVDNKGDITVTQNGRGIDFRFSVGKVEADINLVEGNNVLKVSATNGSGNDSKMVTITYKKLVVETGRTPRAPKDNPSDGATQNDGNDGGKTETPTRTPRSQISAKPSIEITSLSQNVGSPKDPATGASTLIATIGGVNAKSDITVLLNGNSVDFQYDTTTKEIQSAFVLAKGENTVTVKAKNKFGTTEKSQKITY